MCDKLDYNTKKESDGDDINDQFEIRIRNAFSKILL